MRHEERIHRVISTVTGTKIQNLDTSAAAGRLDLQRDLGLTDLDKIYVARELIRVFNIRVGLVDTGKWQKLRDLYRYMDWAEGGVV